MSKKKNKKDKKERKENKKLRSKVEKTFPLKNEMPTALVNAVRINKALIKRDKDAQKAWQEEYFQKLFIDFKELVKKHNEAIGFETDKLIAKIDGLKEQVKTYENKVKKLEEINKLLKENA
jgi:transposase